MSEFQKNAAGILRRVEKGERFLLSYHGRPAARLESVTLPGPADPANDPFFGVAQRASFSPKGGTRHQDLDRILYGHVDYISD